MSDRKTIMPPTPPNTDRKRKMDDDEHAGSDQVNDSAATLPGTTPRRIRRSQHPEHSPALERQPSKHQAECLALYHQGVERLNQSFAGFVMGCEPNLETMQQSTDRPLFMMNACYEYKRVESQLRQLYSPNTVVEGGNVMTWGDNDMLELGYRLPGKSSDPDSPYPLIVRGLDKNEIVSLVCCSGGSNLAINKDGVPITWGNNDWGQCVRVTAGENEDTMLQTPTPVSGFRPSKYAVVKNTEAESEDGTIVAVAGWEGCSLFLTRAGNVYEAGCFRDENARLYRSIKPPDDDRLPFDLNNESGKILLEEKMPGFSRAYVGPNAVPTHIYQLPGKARAIACGATHAMAIMEDDTLYSWGIIYLIPQTHPETGMFLLDERGCYKDFGSALGRDADKLFFKEVVNEKGRRLEGNDENIVNFYLKPAPVKWANGMPNQYKVLSVACGPYRTLVAARYAGSFESLVYGCGANGEGQLGMGDREHRAVMTLAESSKNKNIVEVRCGKDHSLGLDLSREHIYACGRSTEGRLGISYDEPTSLNVLEWTPVPMPERSVEFKSFACGDAFNLAVTTNDDVYSWGFNEDRQLCHDDDSEEWRPRKVAELTRELDYDDIVIHQVDAGAQYSGLLFSRRASSGD